MGADKAKGGSRVSCECDWCGAHECADSNALPDRWGWVHFSVHEANLPAPPQAIATYKPQLWCETCIESVTEGLEATDE